MICPFWSTLGKQYPQSNPEGLGNGWHDVAMRTSVRSGLPPSIRDLIQEPSYRKFFKTRPTVQTTQSYPGATPWVVYGRIDSSPPHPPVWASKAFLGWEEGFRFVVAQIKMSKYDDLALVSKSVLYYPPSNLVMPPAWGRFEWCGRCRRPTRFAIRPRHHALRNAPVLTADEPYRCYYCGARRSFARLMYHSA